MTDFVTKDSGKREAFETGSVRDTQEGKPRWDLMPWEELERVANLYARGAEKYGDDNWRKGQPMRRTFGSLMRHLIAFQAGKRDEDHGAAVIWNMLSLMWHEKNKSELNDLHEKLTTTAIQDRGSALGNNDTEGLRPADDYTKGDQK